MKLVIALLLVTACDRVYGLTGRSDDDAAADDASVDAGEAIHVMGSFKRTAIYTTSSHAPASGTTILTDADRPIVTSFGNVIATVWSAADGSFSFDAPVPYEVAIGALEWQSRSPMIMLDDTVFERPGAPLATSVTLNVTVTPPPSAGETFELISIGAWSRAAIDIPASGAAPFTFSKPNLFGSTAQLLSATAGDLLYLLTYTAGPSSGSRVLSKFASLAIEMHEGAQDAAFTRTVPTQPFCTHVIPTSATELQRLRPLFPDSNDTNAGWQIDAVPLSDYGIRVPLSLFSRSSATGNNEALDVAYGQPFTSFDTVITQVSNATRMLDEASLTSAAFYQDRVTTSQSSCPSAAIGAGAALPTNPVLSGVPLTDDTLTLGVIDADYAELSWQTSGDVPDSYTVELFEAPAAGPLVSVRLFMSGEPRVRIAKALLQPGFRYVFRIAARSGRAGTIAGDFTQRTLPSWAGVAFTSAFTLVQ